MIENAAGLPAAIGPYKIDRVLGRGAMSVVYLARCPQYGKVALKLLRPELLAGPEREASLRRFAREAAVGMRLRHPGIVQVFGHGEADGAPYLAMELAPGRELRDHLPGGDGGPLALPQAVAVLREVLAALHYAHGMGVVHRDIKPANIVLSPDGKPKLADFGIAREEDSDITQAGEMLGTPAFIPPELLAGETATPAGDQFSAGVLAYYLLTGRRPFSGNVATVMRQILFQDPIPPSVAAPALSPTFDAPLLRALAKRPASRHLDVAAFSQALADALVAAAGLSAATTAAAAGDDPDATAPPARKPRSVSDLADALRALQDEPLSERRLTDLRAMLGTTAGATRERLLHVLEQDGLKPAAARIIKGMPAPGAPAPRSDFMLNVRLAAALAGELDRLGEGARAIPHIEKAVVALGDAFQAFALRTTVDLSGDDNPDVMRLTADFLRLDVLAHALEELGAKRELTAAATAMGALTGAVMGKINGVLRACAEENDGFARFGVSVMLNDVEDLIELARRALDGGLIDATGGIGGGAGAAAFRREGQAQVAEFIRLAGVFGDLSMDELRAGIAGETALDGAVFAAKLRPIGALYKFAARLPDDTARSELSALTRNLHRRAAELTLALAAPTAAVEGRADRLTALYELAEELGWREVAAAALGLLRREPRG